MAKSQLHVNQIWLPKSLSNKIELWKNCYANRPFAIRFNLLQSCPSVSLLLLLFILLLLLFILSSFFTHFSGGSLCLSFDKFWDTVPPRGGGGGRLFLGIRGGGVPPGSPSPYPIADPKIDILHTHFQTWPLKSIPFYQKLCHHNLD